MCVGVFANLSCSTGKSAAREKKLGESAKPRSGRMALVAAPTLTTMTMTCNYNVQFPFSFTSLNKPLRSFSMVTRYQDRFSDGESSSASIDPVCICLLPGDV